MLDPLPAGVHAERWVDQERVQAAAGVVVCHGGSGTVFGALAAVVPVVVVPVFADQFENGRRVAAAGAGVVVEVDGGSRARVVDERDAPRIQDAVQTCPRDSSLPRADTGNRRRHRLGPVCGRGARRAGRPVTRRQQQAVSGHPSARPCQGAAVRHRSDGSGATRRRRRAPSTWCRSRPRRRAWRTRLWRSLCIATTTSPSFGAAVRSWCRSAGATVRQPPSLWGPVCVQSRRSVRAGPAGGLVADGAGAQRDVKCCGLRPAVPLPSPWWRRGGPCRVWALVR